MKFLAGLIAALPLASMAASPALLPPRVDKAIHERIDSGRYPALVVAVVDGGHAEVYVFGTLADGKRPDADTVFEIGSVSKTFTTTVLAQDVQNGKLTLDTPVAKLLPGFSMPSRDGKAITLEHLATQRSGLPRLPDNLDLSQIKDPYANYDGAKLKAFLAGYTLTRDPGSAYEYSNLGVGLLGYALAQHAGLPYDALLQKRIFGPLQMSSSATALTGAMRAHLASGHDGAGTPVGNWNFQALAGAGAIKSSAGDMLRYLKANMGQLKSALYPAMQLAHAARADGPGERIGLAWMTRPDPAGAVIWHNGATGGYASFLGFTADGKHGVVILTNISRSVDDLGFATLLADARLPPPRVRIAMSPGQLDAYVGSYRLTPQFVLRIFRVADQLHAQGTGQAALPIFPSARDEFFAEAVDASASFQRDASGKVVGMILHQNGDRPAPRMSEAEAASGQHAVTLTPAKLAQYVGHYQLAPGAMFEVTLQAGQLMVQLTGQPAFPVFASAPDQFFYKVVDAQLTFLRDAGGRITALVLHQGGKDHRAPRKDP